MSVSSNAATDLGLGAPSPTPAAPRRTYLWSVRRELWENRSIWIAPLIVAGVILLGFVFSLMGFVDRFLQTAALPAAKQASGHAEIYEFATMAVILVSIVVAVFYCLGALQGERRDRSILFWKSLPVSDLTTVLAKATIPLAVIPAVAYVLAIALRLVILLVSAAVLAAHGVDPAPLWSAATPASTPVVLLYGLVTISLWYAPIYAWLLLVSAWARRVAFLWAFGPPFGLLIFDRIAFHGLLFHRLLAYRLIGGVQAAFTPQSHTPMGLADMDPLRFLASPGLWTGLAAAAALLAAAVWLRRRRAPD
jgi:ABC-2 type transport system permease protein